MSDDFDVCDCLGAPRGASGLGVDHGVCGLSVMLYLYDLLHTFVISSSCGLRGVTERPTVLPGGSGPVIAGVLPHRVTRD